MGGIGSNVVYIATTLAAGNQPTIAPTDQTDAISIAAPKTDPSEPPAHGYVILDVPNLGGGVNTRSLGNAIAEGLKRSREDYAPSRPEAGASTRQDFSIDDGPAISERGELEGAVVAAHEARIAVLRERIDSLKAGSGTAAATQLRDLSIRLKRAEAARKLAMARMALNEPPRDCDRRGLVSPCGDTPKAATAMIADTPSRQGVAPKHRPIVAQPPPAATDRRAHGRQNIAADRIAGPLRIAAPGRPSPLAATRTPATNARAVPLRGAGHARIATRAAQASLQPGTANRLDRARHLLTVARVSLEGAVAERRYSPIRIAGLWQWAGSDTWSLANYARRNA